jgi:SSU ribosomal protein S12P methylthiotransferase (EC 2.-.-.-)
LTKISIISLGCAKNQVDSEIMSGILERKHVLTDTPDDADVIVVNTCSFIETAKEESINTILDMARFKELGSCQVLLAAGCLAQRYGQELMQEIPELDGILGTGNIDEIEELLKKSRVRRTAIIKPGSPDFLYDENMPRKRLTPKHYAYVKVAEGCDNYCTYCVIPQVRGHFRSRPEESIVKEVQLMASQGVKEILLIAQDTTRYGLDLYGELRLPGLIRLLSAIEGIEWIRLMYCYPDLFSEEIIEVMSQERKVCRYLDLPLQHADPGVLSDMNRRGTIEQAEQLIVSLRQIMPDITIRTTMITGFPGETEKEFNNLQDFVKRIKFERLGVFAYSQEDGTLAAQRTDQVPRKVKEKRREQLMLLQQDIAFKCQQRLVGQIKTVILEHRLPDNRWLGRTEADAPEIDGQVYVNTHGKEFIAGDMVQVYIQEADSYDLLGEVVS